MSKAFKGAANAARSLENVARRSGNLAAARQAQVVSRFVKGLARLERSFEIEGRQLTVALVHLQRSVKSQGRVAYTPGYEIPGYYVEITGRRKGRAPRGFRPADTGLVGRRIGRGPVRMTSSDGQSAKAVTAAFAKLLSAQSQLQQLRSELERVKAKR
jgi:hypothetical protein